MSLIEDLLEKHGLTYGDLDQGRYDGEKEYLDKMQADLKKNTISIDSTRKYLSSMREAVERKLINEPEFKHWLIFTIPNRKQILLKARLENYILLELYLSTPDRITAQIDDMIGNITKKI